MRSENELNTDKGGECIQLNRKERDEVKDSDRITEKETVHVEDDVSDGSFVQNTHRGIGHWAMGFGICAEVSTILDKSTEWLAGIWADQ